MVAPAGVYFLTSRSQWNDYVLPVYALSGAAGLLGVVCHLLEIADLAPAPAPAPASASGAGIAFLVPGGLSELAFPLTGSNRLEESAMPDVSGPGVAPLPPTHICLRRLGWTD